MKLIVSLALFAVICIVLTVKYRENRYKNYLYQRWHNDRVGVPAIALEFHVLPVKIVRDLNKFGFCDLADGFPKNDFRGVIGDFVRRVSLPRKEPEQHEN